MRLTDRLLWPIPIVLDVTEEMSFDLDPDDPRTPELAVYAYLSWLQEQLVEAIAAGLSAGPEGAACRDGPAHAGRLLGL